MEKINYIASAGTGKTYSLVENIVDNYIIKKGVDIDQIFVATFTEKAASELKDRIYRKIKDRIYQNRNNPQLIKKLLHNFRNVQHSYIGTIHSLLLRILKANPDRSGITEETRVIDDIQQEALFFESFELFLEENKERAEILAKYFDSKNQIYAVFKNIYLNVWKIEDYKNENLEDVKATIEKHKKKAVGLLDIFITDYYRDFVEAREYLKTDLKDIYKKIVQENYTQIKIDKNKNFPKLLKQRSIKNHEHFKKLDKKNISKLEDELINTLENLKSYALYFNFLTIIDNFEKFFHIFEERKKNIYSVTYSDIILRSVDIFRKYPDILESYRRRFKAFFIDEFQDTDQLQTEIIRLLSERSDLIIFGDPKQCIYEWRSADLSNYLKFTRDFEEKTLKTCYRSSISLIGFFNLFFKEKDFLNTDYSKDKVCSLNHLAEKYIPELSSPEDLNLDSVKSVELVKTEKDLEPEAVAEKIKQLLNSGYKPEDILVLFRSKSKTERYIDEFRKSNIPFISYLSSNFYNSIEVVTVLNILKLILHPYDQLSLIKVLKSPVFSFSDKELYDIKDRLCIEKIPQLKSIKRLEEIRDRLNISQIMDYIYNEIPVLEIFSIYPDGRQKVANLEKLRFVADRLESENLQLRDFVQFLEKSRFSQEEDAVTTTDESFVKVMTMHKSKGLEAKVVIIPGLSERMNRNTNGFFSIEGQTMVRIRDNQNREIARTLNFDEEKVKEKVYLEEKRLLYVAFTRAKEKLILFHSGNEGYMKEIERVMEDINDKKVKVYKKDGTHVNFVFKIKTSEFSGSSRKNNYWVSIKNGSGKGVFPLLERLEKEEKKRKKEFERAVSLKRFTTVSALVDEKNPKSIIEEFQISEDENLKEKDIYVETGIMVHKILENFSFSSDLDKAEKEIDELFEKFSQLLSEENRRVVRKLSCEKLKRFINSEDYREISSSKIIFKEMPFTLKEKESYIEGKIDLVYEKNGTIYVVDYKTGNIKNESKYEPQKRYYTKIIKKIFPDKRVIFKFVYLI